MYSGGPRPRASAWGGASIAPSQLAVPVPVAFGRPMIFPHGPDARAGLRRSESLTVMIAFCYISPIKMARELQLSLPSRPTWGGRRPGAGRKRARGRRPSVPHHARLPHDAAHPVHVTLRADLAVRCLSSGRAFPSVRRALAGSSTGGFRILHYSVQDDHVHLIVEAQNTRVLSSGVRGLAIRAARAVNRALGRRGAVWSGRYHARPLTTPREVRHALVYVLANRRKHGGGFDGFDACSSAPWFDGWRDAAPVTRVGAPVVRARTWLATVGWRRHGLLRLDERPSKRRHTSH